MRQEIFEGSRTPVDSFDLSIEADIGVTSHFLVLVQQSTPGVNEWLMIRNLDREIFKWLLIRRSEVRHGSENTKPDRVFGGDKRRYRGGRANHVRCDFFAAAARLNRRCYQFHFAEKDLSFLLPPVHLRGFTPYSADDEFPCNLNDMRTKNGSPDWRPRPGFRS